MISLGQRPALVVAALLTVTMTLTCLAYFLPHIRWAVTSSHLQGIRAIPTGSLQVEEITDTRRTQHRVNSLVLSLPADFAIKDPEAPFTTLEGEAGRVTVLKFEDLPSQRRELDNLLGRSDLRKLSLVEIKRRVYAADAAAFSWTMPRQEVTELTFLLSCAMLVRLSGATRVETLVDPFREVMVVWTRDQGAVCDVYKKDYSEGYELVFRPSTMDNIEWIRQCCSMCTVGESDDQPVADVDQSVAR